MKEISQPQPGLSSSRTRTRLDGTHRKTPLFFLLTLTKLRVYTNSLCKGSECLLVPLMPFRASTGQQLHGGVGDCRRGGISPPERMSGPPGRKEMHINACGDRKRSECFLQYSSPSRTRPLPGAKGGRSVWELLGMVSAAHLRPHRGISSCGGWQARAELGQAHGIQVPKVGFLTLKLPDCPWPRA